MCKEIFRLAGQFCNAILNDSQEGRPQVVYKWNGRKVAIKQIDAEKKMHIHLYSIDGLLKQCNHLSNRSATAFSKLTDDQMPSYLEKMDHLGEKFKQTIAKIERLHHEKHAIPIIKKLMWKLSSLLAHLVFSHDFRFKVTKRLLNEYFFMGANRLAEASNRIYLKANQTVQGLEANRHRIHLVMRKKFMVQEFLKEAKAAFKHHKVTFIRSFQQNSLLLTYLHQQAEQCKVAYYQGVFQLKAIHQEGRMLCLERQSLFKQLEQVKQSKLLWERLGSLYVKLVQYREQALEKNVSNTPCTPLKPWNLNLNFQSESLDSFGEIKLDDEIFNFNFSAYMQAYGKRTMPECEDSFPKCANHHPEKFELVIEEDLLKFKEQHKSDISAKNLVQIIEKMMQVAKTGCFYQIFQVSSDYTKEQLEMARKKLMFMMHPDRNFNHFEIADKISKCINEVYNHLMEKFK